MKKIVQFAIFLLPTNCLAARHGGPLLSDFGLPSGDEVGTSLLKAIPFLVIGFIIAYVCMWSKKDGEKTSNFGCIGILLMAVGFVFLLPLLVYVELIVNSIIGVVFTMAIIGAICYGIYSLYKSK